jgi:hypothetical protein
MQKILQDEKSILLDVEVVRNAALMKLSAMENKPYPGGCEEKSVGSLDIADSDLQPSSMKRARANAYVPTRRSFNAVRQEVILTVTNFLEKRIDDDQKQVLKAVGDMLKSTSAADMYEALKPLADSLTIASSDSQDLYDTICDIFAAHADTLTTSAEDRVERFWQVRNFSPATSVLRRLLDAFISAIPHSMTVERVISHYNTFRSAHRLSMTSRGVNNRLLIAINGLGMQH